MSVLQIDDLAKSKDLDKQAMDAVVGGNALGFAMAGGQNGSQVVEGGFGIFSPVIAINTPVNMPVAIDIDTSSLLNIDADISNIIGSAGTAIAA